MSQNSQIDSLKQLATTSKNDSIVMAAYNKLRRATYYTDQKESKHYTEQFLKYASKRGDSLRIAFANFYLGNAYALENQYATALSYYVKTQRYYERVNDQKRLPSVVNAIGNIYEKKGEDSIAIEYYMRSSKISKQNKDARRAAIGLINAGNVYQNTNRFDKAIESIEEAISILDEHRAENPKAIAKTQQIYYKAKLNLAAAFRQDKKTEKAQELYSYLFKNLDSIDDRLIYSHALQGQGDLYFDQKSFAQSIPPYENALRIFQESGFQEAAYQVMPSLVASYRATNKYEKGLLLLSTYNSMKDSIFNLEENKILNEAIKKYEVAQKEQLIAQKNLEIEQKNSQRTILLISIAAIVLLAIILLFFYRKRAVYKITIVEQEKKLKDQEIDQLKQEAKSIAIDNMLVGQEQERARIAADLHDSLGGLLSSAKSHFLATKATATNKNSVPKTAVLLDQAYEEVRRISHNMMPKALAVSGLHAAITDIAENLEQENYHVTLELNSIPTLTETHEIMLYRIIQELINNIKKHANATTIFIQLYSNANTVFVTVEDDGAGFDVATAKQKRGLGLQNIESRITLLNGVITWDTQIGKGTTVLVSFEV
ncbi:MAG: ATP-binding protein [Bacteroidota bacterium]